MGRRICKKRKKKKKKTKKEEKGGGNKMKCKVKALVELSGVITQPFQGTPKNSEEDQKLRDIAEDFITAMKQTGESADIRIIASVEEG